MNKALLMRSVLFCSLLVALGTARTYTINCFQYKNTETVYVTSKDEAGPVFLYSLGSMVDFRIMSDFIVSSDVLSVAAQNVKCSRDMPIHVPLIALHAILSNFTHTMHDNILHSARLQPAYLYHHDVVSIATSLDHFMTVQDINILFAVSSAHQHAILSHVSSASYPMSNEGHTVYAYNEKCVLGYRSTGDTTIPRLGSYPSSSIAVAPSYLHYQKLYSYATVTNTPLYIEEVSESINLSYVTSRLTATINQCGNYTYSTSYTLLDYGSTPHYDNVYTQSRFSDVIVNQSHFISLDAQGAMLHNNTLLLPAGGRLLEVFAFVEVNAYKVGYSDSVAMAPPLRITTASSVCSCDLFLPGTHVIFGIVHYPQYGHAMFNTFSNLFYLLSVHRLASVDVVIYPMLYRNTSGGVPGVAATRYLLHYTPLYEEIFSLLTQNRVMWRDMLDYNPSQRICFERVLVSAPPWLDLFNATVPPEMWYEFANNISALVMPSLELQKESYIYQNSCKVTFLERKANAVRSILNMDELETIAIELGCSVQRVSFENVSLAAQLQLVRYNTTLLVGAEGTGLLNSVFMLPCNAVLMVEMWMKPAFLRRLYPAGLWMNYRISANETYFHSSHRFASLLSSLSIDELNVFDWNSLNATAREIEDFLRDHQAGVVRGSHFRDILHQAILYREQCLLDLNM